MRVVVPAETAVGCLRMPFEPAATFHPGIESAAKRSFSQNDGVSGLGKLNEARTQKTGCTAPAVRKSLVQFGSGVPEQCFKGHYPVIFYFYTFFSE